MSSQPVTTQQFQDDRLARKLAELTAAHTQFVRLANEVMHDLNARTSSHSPTRKLTVIQETVTDAFGVTMEELLGTRRPQWIVRPRHVAIWIARTFTAIPSAFIAEAFGKDIGTITHACRSIDGLRARETEVKERTDALLEQCRSRIQTEDLPLFHLNQP